MNDVFVIRGGKPLSGSVEVRGSKNAASKLMIASLLTEESCVIENIPLSAETEITRELCERIGSQIICDEKRVCRISTPVITTSRVPELSRRNRIPILALGPLLHRTGSAEVPVLGGCPIGHRPINFHVAALTDMGVRMERREHSYWAEAGDIHGAEIKFPFPSVGATENVLLTAVRAKGRTIMRNAAIEPEILNLIRMLNAMGGRIRVDENSRIMEIDGVDRLGGAVISVIPDRNEVVSLASAALATGGEVEVHGAEAGHLEPFLGFLDELGASWEEYLGGIRFSGAPPYRAVSIQTGPHPAFMTDWQQPFCVVLTRAEGTSVIHETVYEDRFGYAKDLNRMGAAIATFDDCDGFTPCRFAYQGFYHRAAVSGPRFLSGRDLAMTDIRAGMAHIIAALAAGGESVITGVQHLDRGYEKIDERLRSLGADIRRVS